MAVSPTISWLIAISARRRTGAPLKMANNPRQVGVDCHLGRPRRRPPRTKKRPPPMAEAVDPSFGSRLGGLGYLAGPRVSDDLGHVLEDLGGRVAGGGDHEAGADVAEGLGADGD